MREAGYVSLRDHDRGRRRTIADAIEVVCDELLVGDVGSAQVSVGPLQLPSAPRAAIVAVIFRAHGCCVSLATAARFKARAGTGARREEFDIARLDHAEVCSDGSVLLADGTRLLGVEVIPTPLRYHLSELDQRIIHNLIRMNRADHCLRNLRDDVPEVFRQDRPDLWVLDFSRIRTIEAPLLKVFRAYIELNDPMLKVSNQKIADTLALCGVRVPRRRRRRDNLATI